MVRDYLLRTACALALVCSLTNLLGCDARTRVQGTVFDSDGNPVAKATVRLTLASTGRAAETATKDDGAFSVELIHGPFAKPFDLVVSKVGYLTVQRQIESKTDQHLRINLPRPASTPAGIVREMFPQAPDKVSEIGCFRSLTRDTPISAVVQMCGRPDEEVGSGIYIFLYHLADGSSVAIGTPSLDRIYYVIHTDTLGKSTYLLDAK